MTSAPAAKNSFAICGRDAVAAGGVLAVDHDRIQLEVGAKAGQALEQDGPAGAADHVANEEDAQAGAPGI